MPERAYAAEFLVGYENIFIPIEYDNSYLDVALWYPVAFFDEDKKNKPQESGEKVLRTRLQALGELGKRYEIAKKAKPLQVHDENNKPSTFPLIVLSNPSFANSETFASLSHALASAGFFVASILHVGDWQQDMRYNFSALQNPMRALHIKLTCEFLLQDAKYPVSLEDISVLSFYENSLSAIMLYGYFINKENYIEFCQKYSDEKFCSSPFKEQVEYMYEDTSAFYRNLQKAKNNYEIKNASANAINSALNAQWQLAISEAQKMSEPLPPEPKWVSAPGKPKDIDIYYPFIKNFYFIEPQLSFLFDAKLDDENIEDDKFNLYAFFSQKESQINNEVESLKLKYGTHFHEQKLMADDLYNLADICTTAEEKDLTAVCAKVSKEEHQEIIDEFIENIKIISSN